MKPKAYLLKHRSFLLICMMFACIYLGTGTYNPYITLFYQSKELTTSQIGVISAIGPIATLLLQTAWGTLADRTSRKGVLIFALIGSALCAGMYLFGASYLYILIIALLYTIFNTAVLPMCDAMALNFCSHSGFRFAPIRMSGTIGYALAGFLFGGLFSRDMNHVFPLYILFCALAVVATLFYPTPKPSIREKVRAEKEPPRKKVSMLPLLRDPVVIFLLMSNFVVYIGASSYTYLALYASELSFDGALCGQLFSIAATAEIPALLLIDRILEKIPAKKIILATCVLMAVRIFVTYIAGFCGKTSLLVLIFGQLMQAVTYIPCYYCAAKMIHERFPDELKSTAQTLLALVTTGLGRILANLLGGYLSEPDVLGLQNTFLFFAVFIALGTAAIFFCDRVLLRKEISSIQPKM